MLSNKFLFSLFLILSFAISMLNSSQEFKEIESMKAAEFKINTKETAYFKYKLNGKEAPIGLKFILANLYTVNVLVYKTYDDENNNELFEEYQLAHNQFKEINVKDFGEYVYIVIKMTNIYYYYQDYLMIYDCNKPIELKANEVLTINNFLSNNKYIINFPVTDKDLVVYYNTQNSEDNERIITIEQGEKIYIDQGNNSYYKQSINIETNDTLIIIIENRINEVDNDNINQEFSIIVYENENNYNFNNIIQEETKKISYIFNDEPQIFYFYANITSYELPSTLNFKLNYNYFNTKNIKIKSSILELNEEINQEYLENNIPKENLLKSSYDDESDEYYRIYFNKQNSANKYSYILVSLEINDATFYRGSRALEISLSNSPDIHNFENIPANELQKIEVKSRNYVPYYLKLKLEPDEKYVLTSKNQFITKFIKGDLLQEDNINKNYLENSNELIVLSNIEELTIKIFGSGKNVIFNIEKMNISEFEYRENERNNNEIYEFNMEKGQIKYILGTFNVDEYAFGELKVNYYGTIESGDFELYYRNNISDNEVGSIFSMDDKYSQKFYEIFTLKTNLDLFVVKCKESGTMSLRPQYKTFNLTTHLIKENSFNEINIHELSEVVQLSAPIAKSTNSETLYFSVHFINNDKLLNSDNETAYVIISPDTPGVFDEGKIQINEIFKTSINLKKYAQDQLAFYVTTNVYSILIEVTETIKDKYTSYTEIQEGENKGINANNVFWQIDLYNQSAYINITVENLQNEEISLGIIQTSEDDKNYIATADKYPNSIKKKITKPMESFYLKNEYYNNQTNEIENYLYFIMSILGNKDNLNYNLNIQFIDEEEIPPSDTTIDTTSDSGQNPAAGDKDDNTATIAIICVVVGVVVILLVILLIYHFKKKKNSDDIEKISSLEPTNQLI